MKKVALLLFTCILIVSLSGCGEKKENNIEIQQNITSSLPDANLTDVEGTSNDKYEKASTFMDKNVEELIAAIGEPNSKEYTSSCLGDGEDGNLDYGEFWVNTYKEKDAEVVKSVNLK